MNDKLRAEKYSKMKEIVRKQEILISKKPIDWVELNKLSAKLLVTTNEFDAENRCKEYI